jgi:hypothetical protein
MIQPVGNDNAKEASDRSLQLEFDETKAKKPIVQHFQKI